ncbi:MAG: protein-export membrane protein SecF [Candidatus Kerfeldbacteria bacterium RIFCSPLOWO2_01_FULL_48_11]|uniref:Protein-export membrane protein SecF n=1 Tax=Candidatus Kerfeldbacteria bacterium RIFCSPLOWO2_01_FULL_48_11 TaxID=1798543 RepID=A0A1G2B0R1_9BACT|nr:MAG: Protein translocase subunit SecF [Parcubacteria group bacterium GW2011_GWA2_48_9]KKW16337.1 MAG: Protein translocase subunit SecF [Parcubacteria group bacterium GW2011_GWC2_49_9]OGY82754.1 MAG: protein-export membrane protein SecF [Candidatus Kerfeldbacteria bacterium RIFCSPLOWO2_01_FULL_48_11]HCJ52633.1 protein translocase subunit SecF [Candidatus Kerfeldbacteria bacterium]HCM67904.1 protein translocase subunit SecF [Candidatus Kerfeldbacteria bacterium]
MYRIIQKRKVWYAISLILLIPGTIALVAGGLKFGIDFTGGSLTRYTFADKRPSVTDVVDTLRDNTPTEYQAQLLGDKDVLLRTSPMSKEQRTTIQKKFTEQFGQVEEASYEEIGPTIGKELRSRSISSIIIVLGLITAYISLAFRKVGTSRLRSWVFGTAAIVALGHDLLFVVGVFAILGYFFSIEIGSLFVTALLTTLGFSVHDTIVVFDRIRERLRFNPAKTFEETVNESVNQTLVRSLNTSLCTLLVLICLYLFGGESIKTFVLALIMGISIGTYSSIFVASPLVVTWDFFQAKRGR